MQNKHIKEVAQNLADSGFKLDSTFKDADKIEVIEAFFKDWDEIEVMSEAYADAHIKNPEDSKHAAISSLGAKSDQHIKVLFEYIEPRFLAELRIAIDSKQERFDAAQREQTLRSGFKYNPHPQVATA